METKELLAQVFNNLVNGDSVAAQEVFGQYATEKSKDILTPTADGNETS